MKIRYLSLFSGIGGFEVGMEKSKHNFKCISFSEIDKYGISIYTRHFPRHKSIGDVTRVNAEELEDFELLVAGFPCQAFSIVGKRKGFADTRGTLFFEIARILAVKQPKHFLLENVKGLLSHNCGRTFQRILAIINELGYDAQWEVHNSCNYGVPQHRQRLYIKGYSRERCGHEILDIREEVERSQQRRSEHRLLKTKQEGKMSDDYIIRRLTPIECERLQGFEDDWTKWGKDDELISDSQRYRLLGNAVTTNVVEHIFNNWNLNGENYVKEKSESVGGDWREEGDSD